MCFQADKEWRVVTEYLDELIEEFEQQSKCNDKNLHEIDVDNLNAADRPRPLKFDPDKHKVSLPVVGAPSCVFQNLLVLWFVVPYCTLRSLANHQRKGDLHLGMNEDCPSPIYLFVLILLFT